METNIFLTKEILDQISYTSVFTQSLKTISLRNTSLVNILEDIAAYRDLYAKMLVTHGSLISSRFKSEDSIRRKYDKILRQGGGFKQCFNDVLGFRVHLDTYPMKYPEYFRAVDLRRGKMRDDGYRAVHLYYQRDSHSYPIEIQLWCGRDYSFNIWSHKWAYKYYDDLIGRQLRQLYDNGLIGSETDFCEQLERLHGGK